MQIRTGPKDRHGQSTNNQLQCHHSAVHWSYLVSHFSLAFIALERWFLVPSSLSFWNCEQYCRLFAENHFSSQMWIQSKLNILQSNFGKCFCFVVYIYYLIYKPVGRVLLRIAQSNSSIGGKALPCRALQFTGTQDKDHPVRMDRIYTGTMGQWTLR